jgi:hypothetical protein
MKRAYQSIEQNDRNDAKIRKKNLDNFSKFINQSSESNEANNVDFEWAKQFIEKKNFIQSNNSNISFQYKNFLPKLNADKFTSMEKILINWYEANIPKSLSFYVFYKCVVLQPKQIFVHKLHKMLLSLAINNQPVTTLYTLKNKLFMEFSLKEIIIFIFEFCEIEKETKKILLRYMPDEFAIDMPIFYNDLLYHIFFKDPITSDSNINIQKSLFEDFFKFYNNVILMENQLNTVMKNFQKIPNLDFSFFQINELNEEEEKSSEESDEIIATPCRRAGILEKLLDGTNCKITHIDFFRNDETVLMEKIYTKMKTLFKKDYFFNKTKMRLRFFSFLFSFNGLDKIVYDFMEFITIHFFHAAENQMWIGSEWKYTNQISKELFGKKDNIEIYTNLKIKKHPSLLLKPPPLINKINRFINNREDGNCHFIISDHLEKQSPANFQLKRIFNFPISNKYLYKPSDTNIAKLCERAFNFVCLFYNVIQNQSIIEMLLYFPLINRIKTPRIVSMDMVKKNLFVNYDECEELPEKDDKAIKYPITRQVPGITENDFLNGLDYLNSLEEICQIKELEELIFLLCNLTINTSNWILMPKKMAMLLFGKGHFFMFDQTIANSQDILITDDDGQDEMEKTYEDFLSSILEQSAIIDMTNKINIAPKITHAQQNSKGYESQNKYYHEWPQNIKINKGQISRINVFQQIINISKSKSRSFNINSIPKEEKRELCILLFLFLRSPPKKIDENHILYNSILHHFWTKRQTQANFQLRQKFPFVGLFFDSSESRIELSKKFIKFLNKESKFFKTERLQSFEFYDEILAAVHWIYQFSNFNVDNLIFLLQFIKYLELPGNFKKKFLYLYGTSNSGKSKLLDFLSTLYNSGHPNKLSQPAITKEENELNNSLLPLSRCFFCAVDEFNTLNVVLINKLCSDLSLSTRNMFTQGFKTLLPFAVLILANNQQIDVKSNAGFETRLITIHQRGQYRTINTNQTFHDQTASHSWALNFTRRLYIQGLDEKKIEIGLFLINKNFSQRFLNPRNRESLELVLSDEYRKDTIELLKNIDPLYMFIHNRDCNSTKSLEDEIEEVFRKLKHKLTNQEKKELAVRYREEGIR